MGGVHHVRNGLEVFGSDFGQGARAAVKLVFGMEYRF